MKITEAGIQSVLKGLEDLPTPVDSWEVKTGVDWADDPAVWVWAILKDDDVDFTKRSTLRSKVRSLIRSETDGVPWVYVMFRGQSEVEQST